MRARYAAYSLNRPRFLIATTSPENPGFKRNQKRWFRELKRYCSRTTFTGLEIFSVVLGSHADEGFVTFRASLNENGRDRSFTERSRFVRRDGVWLYHSGELG